ncbi:short-chain dehydrogenase reductase protein [Rutstroemia sp. NJR-2017a BBW]|nr:short-chain dehydrogenase reductase protein [Rutstroemia sp. NJR-2017a BBW]
MVSIKAVRASNASFKTTSAPGMVAVFAGATSGIGMGTLKAFVKNANSPTAYIVGRSKKAAASLLDELQKSNPSAKLNFIETEFSLIKNVDAISDEIKSKEKKVDFVFLSAGYLTWDGRLESTEGIDVPHALRYYSRIRLAYNLIPLLQVSPNPRVISILAGGQESAIDLDDLEVKNEFSTIKAAKNGTTQTTLALEELAKQYPGISFVHKYPGFVDTGVIDRLMKTTKGFLWGPATVFRWLLLPVVNLFSTTVEEAGERGLFIATIANPSVVDSEGKGNGVYRLAADDESAPNGTVLPAYRKENAGAKVWESTLAVWERALGRSG